jgi:glycosyltransferase involved in cell wall biosynthesis
MYDADDDRRSDHRSCRHPACPGRDRLRVRIVFDVTPLSVPPTGIGTWITETASACAADPRAPQVTAFSITGRGETIRLDANLGLDPRVERNARTVRGASYLRAVINRLPVPLLEPLCGRVDAFVGSEWLYPRQRRGVRVAVVHDLIPLRFPQWTTRQTRRLHLAKLRDVRRADVVICNSDATARDVTRLVGVDEARISVAHPGVSDRFRTATSQPPDGLDGRPYVVSVCTLEPRKNLGTLLDAYQEIHRRRRDLALVLVGAGGWGDDGVTRRIASLGLQRDVLLTGYLPASRVAGVVAGARVFCWPALFEGFGMPVCEAQAAGVPVVCSDDPSMDEAAGDACLRVSPRDTRGIAAAIETAADDDGVRDALRRRGLAHTASLTWQRTASVLLDAVAAVAARR